MIQKVTNALIMEKFKILIKLPEVKQEHNEEQLILTFNTKTQAICFYAYALFIDQRCFFIDETEWGAQTIYSYIFPSDIFINLSWTFIVIIKKELMELGVAIVIFLAIGIVVMALFCLITRYFNKKLQRALEDQN